PSFALWRLRSTTAMWNRRSLVHLVRGSTSSSAEVGTTWMHDCGQILTAPHPDHPCLNLDGKRPPLPAQKTSGLAGGGGESREVRTHDPGPASTHTPVELPQERRRQAA